MNPTEAEYYPRLKRGERNLVATGDALLSPGAKPSGEGKPHCKKCRCRVRGPEHEDGNHHRGIPIKSPQKSGRRR
jgi:hypothetical protein